MTKKVKENKKVTGEQILEVIKAEVAKEKAKAEVPVKKENKKGSTKKTEAVKKTEVPEKNYTTKEALVIIKEKTGKVLTGKQYRRILRSLEKWQDGKYTNYALSMSEILHHCKIIAGTQEEKGQKKA